MSATLFYEPYQLPAGLLALAVHIVFFALLYFGFTWQTQTASVLSVELWQSLPEYKVVPPVPLKVEEIVEPVQAVQPQPVQAAQPEQLAKPDIALPDKKEIKKAGPKPDVAKPEKKKLKPNAVEKVEIPILKQNLIERGLAELAEQRLAEIAQMERIAAQQAVQAARERAEQDAARDAEVDEYKAKITAKIRRNIVKPPDVPDDARAEFRVTLLPGGTVLSAELKKSSGNVAYDNAVERAILKSQPLPLPADVAMFNRFRVLLLVFRPTE